MLTTWNLQTTASTGTTPNGVTVDYAEFALAHPNGNPWSDWGKGLVHSNGKIYAAIGDHLGINGNSWLYEYDPNTKVLKAVADLQTSIAGFQPTDYGVGKVHGRLNEGADGNIYFASYWGTTNNDANYVGDHIFQYNPTSAVLTDLGIPEPGYGYPSTNMWSNGNIFYAEAFDKFTDPNYTIHFLAYDLTTHQVKYFGGHTGSSFGRSFFVDASGNAYFNNGGGHLDKYNPLTNTVTELPNLMPGSQIRQITRPDANGYMYATLQDTQVLFRFNPADGSFTSLTTTEADTPAMDLDPTGRYIYYMPGGHNAWGTSNDPIIQYDIQTNTKRTITTLSDYVATNYLNYLGGSYNVTVSPDGRTVYIGLNADKTAAKTGFDNPVFAAIHIPNDGQTVFPSAFSFTDVTTAAGIAPLTSGQYFHTSAWGDVNGDGKPDLFVGTFNDATGTQGPCRLLINDGDGTFTQSIQPALNITNARSAGAAFADFDNDGDQDLILVTNYRSTVPSLNHLFRNDGSGNFTDVTAGSNLNIASFSGRTPFVLDYDNDGKLDVFLQEDIFGGAKSSHLMRNTGNMVFQDVTVAAGLPTGINGLGGAVGDVNGDGYVDLMISQTILASTNTPDNRLYLNNGNGTFRTFNAAVLNSSAWRMKAGNDDWTAGAAFGDLNNDGKLDLVIGSHNESALKHADSGAWPSLIRVYLNQGNDGSGNPIFQDVTVASGIAGIYAKQPDIHLEDVDNDGYLDIETSAVLGLNGDANNPQPVIYRNRLGDTGSLSFALSSGLDPTTWANWTSPQLPGPVNPRYYPGGGMADYDGDGKLDFFGQEALQVAAHNSPLLKNTTANSNHYLDVKIDQGAGTGNRYGIGATVEIYRAGQSGNLAALLGKKTISLSDGFSTGSLPIAHFGLGANTSVDVIVKLPGGSTLTQSSATSNQTLTVTPGATFQPLTWSSILTSTEYGAPPHLKAFDPATGLLIQSYFTFDAGFLGGIRVALGDVNGDGTPDAIVGAGPGAGPHVKVFNGATGQLLPGSIGSFWAFEQGFDNGLFVASADIDRDGKDDVIVGADGGAGPHVKVFSGASGAEIRSFFAFDSGFTGGVRVAGGDVNGDGQDDLIIGAGPGAGPHVKAFDGATGALLDSFWGFDPGFDSGIYVTAGEMNSDGKAEIVVSAGAGAGPHVRVFDGSGTAVLASFFAFDSGFGGGVRVASRDVNGDGRKDIVAMSGYGAAHVKVFDLTDFYNPPVLEDFIAFDGYGGGIYAG